MKWSMTRLRVQTYPKPENGAMPVTTMRRALRSAKSLNCVVVDSWDDIVVFVPEGTLPSTVDAVISGSGWVRDNGIYGSYEDYQIDEKIEEYRNFTTFMKTYDRLFSKKTGLSVNDMGDKDWWSLAYEWDFDGQAAFDDRYGRTTESLVEGLRDDIFG